MGVIEESRIEIDTSMGEGEKDVTKERVGVEEERSDEMR